MQFLNILLTSALVLLPIHALEDCTDAQEDKIVQTIPANCFACLGNTNFEVMSMCKEKNCRECINEAKQFKLPTCKSAQYEVDLEAYRVSLITDFTKKCNIRAQGRVHDHPSNHLRQPFH